MKKYTPKMEYILQTLSNLPMPVPMLLGGLIAVVALVRVLIKPDWLPVLLVCIGLAFTGLPYIKSFQIGPEGGKLVTATENISEVSAKIQEISENSALIGQ